MEPDQNLYQVTAYSKRSITKVIFIVSFDSEEAMKKVMRSGLINDESEIQKVEVELIARDSRSSESDGFEEVCFLAM